MDLINITTAIQLTATIKKKAPGNSPRSDSNSQTASTIKTLFLLVSDSGTQYVLYLKERKNQMRCRIGGCNRKTTSGQMEEENQKRLMFYTQIDKI